MRMIHKSLRMSIEARLVVTVTVSVLLGLGISVQNSQAGICRDNGTNCTSSADCPEGDICLLLLTDEISSNSTLAQTTCCVGGEKHGNICLGIGWCFAMPLQPCRTGEECPPLDPACIINDCPGGSCEPCCYIATATFGSELEDKTDVLRSFRDEYLLNNAVGKAFVKAYYKYSPPLADYIAERDWLRPLVRILLLPVIGLVSLFV